MFNDIQQYWLGSYVNVDDGGTDHEIHQPYPLVGVEDEFAGLRAGLNADGSA